jgi:GNAT superfamily N-acetyltransferase
MITLLISGIVYAGNPKYEKAMKEALGQLQQCKNIEDFNLSANTFYRIANAEKSEWLPSYYYAYSYVIMSFIENEDRVKKDEYLDVAASTIDLLLKTHPEESELYALQGFMYTARLVVDPATRGQKYTQLSGQAIGQALAINKTNPRALYIQLSNETGMARFFGNDIAPYCERISQLQENWEAYNDSPQFYPIWGKREVEGLAKDCEILILK